MALIQASLAMVVVLLALRHGGPVFTWLRLMGLRFAHRRARVVEPQQLPPLLEPVFREAAVTLESLGFAFSHAQWTPPLETAEPVRPTHVYVDEETGTHAEVAPSLKAEGRRPFTVVFTTKLESGRVVMTMDGMRHLMALPLPGVDLHDPRADDIAAQWRAHRGALGSERGAAQTPSVFASEKDSLQRACLDAAIETGEVFEGGARRWRLHPATAWRSTLERLEGERASAVEADGAAAPGASGWIGDLGSVWRRIAARPEKAAVAPATLARIAAEAWAFEATRGGRFVAGVGRFGWPAIGLGTAAFAVIFGMLFSWSAVPALLVVVLLHELGHVAAMAAVGFNEGGVLMLPLSWGGVPGRKRSVTPAERTMVHLLGPLPGLLLGIACLWFGPSDGWIRELGTWAFALNYLFLLPIPPLDGGRVVEALFLERYPYAGVAALAIAAAAVAAAGLALGDSVVLALALLIALSLPIRWRTGRVAAQVAWVGAAGPVGLAAEGRAGRGGVATDLAHQTRLCKVFEVLRRPEYRRLAAGPRRQVARGAMSQLAAQPARRSLVTTGGLLYLLLLVAPAGGVAPFLGTLDRRATAAGACDNIARLDRPNAPPAATRATLVELCAEPGFVDLPPATRWATLMGRAEAALFRGEHAVAVPYLQLAAEAANQAWGALDPRSRETNRRWREAVEAANAAAAAAARAAPARPRTGDAQILP